MSDLISRQAAINGADEIIQRDRSGNNDVVKAMTAWKEWVKALPSAEPGWIPVTERLPEFDRVVLVTRNYLGDSHNKPYTYVEVAAYRATGEWDCLTDDFNARPNSHTRHTRPIAWIYMPNPYQEADHE